MVKKGWILGWHPRKRLLIIGGEYRSTDVFPIFDGLKDIDGSTVEQYENIYWDVRTLPSKGS